MASSTIAKTDCERTVIMKTYLQIHTAKDNLKSPASKASLKKSLLGRLPGITLGLLSFGSLLAYSPASLAQSCPTKPTVCSPGNHCPVPQYRSGPTHTGYSYNDILDATSIVNGCLSLKFPAVATNNGSSSWAYPTFGPSSSPSAITRTIFASVDNSGNYGLWSYGIAGGSYGWDTISAGTVISSPIQATPGYPVHLPQPFIFAGSEDGKLYAFGYTNGQNYWTYDTKNWIDSSPVVTDAYEVYALDSSANIHKVDGNTGKLIWKINSSVYPTATVGWDSTLNSPTVGNYPCPGSCSAVFVAGNNTNFSPNGTGLANAFKTSNGGPLWPGPVTFPYPLTSSPVLSEAQSLVYVQSKAGFTGRDWRGALLYALNSSNGTVDWTALPAGNPPVPPKIDVCNGVDWYFNGGSPAYDDSQSIGPVVVSVARINYEISDCYPTSVTFRNSILTAYNAKHSKDGGGSVVWTVDIYHSISYSSPSISNGVVYVGTDDGYVLAFDENNNGNPIWTSPQMLNANGHPDPVLGPPVISWNRIEVTTQSGTLYVYGLPGY
jgi:eukaryotic-like serine/threonine-protein kinase